MPGGQLPAAHGPAGHQKDAPNHCGARRCTWCQDALLRAEPGPGADGRPLGLVVEITQLAWRSGRTWPGAERQREVPAAGSLRQLPALLDSCAVGAQPTHRDLAQARAYGEHALHPGIFNFVKCPGGNVVWFQLRMSHRMVSSNFDTMSRETTFQPAALKALPTDLVRKKLQKSRHFQRARSPPLRRPRKLARSSSYGKTCNEACTWAGAPSG